MLRKRNLTKATEKLIISRQELYFLILIFLHPDGTLGISNYGYIVISRGLIYQLGDHYRGSIFKV